jgi:hypothetical protein
MEIACYSVVTLTNKTVTIAADAAALLPFHISSQFRGATD